MPSLPVHSAGHPPGLLLVMHYLGLDTSPKLAAFLIVTGALSAPLTYALVKGLGMLKVDTYSLPNVLAGERVVPELMQHDCTPERLAEAVGHWLHDPQAVAALQPRFLALHEQLRQDASARAADAVAGLLEPRRGR